MGLGLLSCKLFAIMITHENPNRAAVVAQFDLTLGYLASVRKRSFGPNRRLTRITIASFTIPRQN